MKDINVEIQEAWQILNKVNTKNSVTGNINSETAEDKIAKKKSLEAPEKNDILSSDYRFLIINLKNLKGQWNNVSKLPERIVVIEFYNQKQNLCEEMWNIDVLRRRQTKSIHPE